MNFVVLYKGFIVVDIMSFISLNFSLSEVGRKRDKAEEKSKSLVVLSFWNSLFYFQLPGHECKAFAFILAMFNHCVQWASQGRSNFPLCSMGCCSFTKRPMEIFLRRSREGKSLELSPCFLRWQRKVLEVLGLKVPAPKFLILLHTYSVLGTEPISRLQPISP